ncbi:hypothetical protein [Neorhodopirellula pilleata]|uniref:Uncharacterized protein n=1 Tax=Neorhodopirellula pilleata TaxID=2714738 RepID=A0A5C6AXL4_9BACT|nr:hypothetical protein [Neorhodopirellula pilleata]TWU03782.1 hypothetical protein Pla100_07120 [Neorhodopirellula pilleata]
MNFSSVEASYGAVEELEWPDIWDDYERAVRNFADAHRRPCEEFGISEEVGGPLIHQLRFLDPKGECIAALQRWQASLHKAEDSLRRLLKRLPDDWRSAKVLDRISRLFELEQCAIDVSLVESLRKMHVDNESLVDLVAFSKTLRGFEHAVEAIERVGTKEAREAISRIAHTVTEHPTRLNRLGDAAIAISVQLNEPKVIPLLVNRLAAAYANASKEPPPIGQNQTLESPPIGKIVAQLLTVIEGSGDRLQEKLLIQLAGLGLVDTSPEEVERRRLENPHLGVEQAMITRDLLPVRTAARREIEKRKIAS